MSTVRKSITFTKQMDKWISSLVSRGLFTNDSEYIRDLVRRDQANHGDLVELKAAIAEGLESGESNRSLDDIWAEAEDEHRQKNA